MILRQRLFAVPLVLLLAVVLGFSGVSAGFGAGGVGVGVGAGGFGVGSTGFGAGVGGFSTTGLVGCTTSAGKSFRTTAFTFGGGVLAGFSCTGLGFSGACGGGGGGAGCSWAGCAAPPFSRGAGAPSASGLSSPSGVPKSTKVNSSTVTGSGGSLLFHASANSPACSKLTTMMTEGFKRL